MPPLTTISESTANRNYPVPVSTNKLSFEINRIRMALVAIDSDIANLLLGIIGTAPVNSPEFTGVPTAPTPTSGDNTNAIATTAFVAAALAVLDFTGYAPIDNPTFTGSPQTPTAALSDNSTTVANTAFVQGIIAQLVGSAPDALNTLQELAAAFQNNPASLSNLITLVGTKASQTSVDAKLDAVRAFVDIASAATTSIGGAASENVRITGTTTITSFGAAAAGTVRRIRMAAALTLTHNAGSLILPGGANITTASNDSFLAVSLGSSNWIVLAYDFATKAGQRNYMDLGGLATMDLSDLMYTGSSSGNTSFPVTSYLFAQSDDPARNAGRTIRLTGGDDGRFNTSSGTALTGTFRGRGTEDQAGSRATLFQRTA